MLFSFEYMFRIKQQQTHTNIKIACGKKQIEQSTQEFTVFYNQRYKIHLQWGTVQCWQLFKIYSLIWKKRWTCAASFQVEEAKEHTVKESHFSQFNKVCWIQIEIWV